MTDSFPIGNRAHVRPANNIDTPSKGNAEKVTDNNVKAPTNVASDEVVLSQGVEAALSDASFDSAKVASIKAAIESGNYPLDAKRTAESFLALEKMIGIK